MEPLENFRSAWKPDEPSRLDPVFVERTSLRDALAAESGLSPQNVLGVVELVEPTFQVADPLRPWLSSVNHQSSFPGYNTTTEGIISFAERRQYAMPDFDKGLDHDSTLSKITVYCLTHHSCSAGCHAIAMCAAHHRVSATGSSQNNI